MLSLPPWPSMKLLAVLPASVSLKADPPAFSMLISVSLPSAPVAACAARLTDTAAVALKYETLSLSPAPPSIVSLPE